MTTTDSGSPIDNNVSTAGGLPPALKSAWLGPLVAYAITLGAAFALAVLTIFAMAGDGGEQIADDTGEAGDALTGALALLALPFQLTGMALAGQLHIAEDGFEFGLFALPLLLTAMYAGTVHLLARRSERRTPSRSQGERALVSALLAVGATVVIMLGTRLLALRADGISLHAASVSLVFGAFAVTCLADYSGRLREALILPASARPWLAAAATWVVHVASWLVILLPLLFVYAWVEGGFRTALALPVYGATAGLWAYALGHLSPLSAMGETAYAWEDGPLLAIVLIILALVVAVVASVAWHLRSRRDVQHLAQPVSWVTLPLTFAAGGFVLMLLTTLAGSGSLAGFGGSVTIAPAAWTPMVLAVWGLAIELLTRTLAPRLAPALPARVSGILGGRPHEGAEAVTITPMSPEQAARTKRMALIIGGAVALILGAVVAVSTINSVMFSSDKAAERYLDAVSSGDVDEVLDLSEAPDGATTDLLTNAVYEKTADRPESYELGESSSMGGSTYYDVSAGGSGAEGGITLEQDGKRFLFFDQWKVTDGIHSTLDVTADSSFRVNGVEIKAPDGGTGSYAVLPGTYTVDLFDGNPWVDGGESEVVAPLDGWVSPEVGELQPSQEFKDEVDRQVSEWLDGCMARTEAEPSGCPQDLWTFGDVRNITWELTTEPTVDYSWFSPEFPMDLSADGAVATATYEEDESYGYGPKDWTKKSEDSDLWFNLTVDVSGDSLVVTPDAS